MNCWTLLPNKEIHLKLLLPSKPYSPNSMPEPGDVGDVDK